jgi:UDP-galactose transporter B1
MMAKSLSSENGSNARFALLAVGVWVSFLVFGFTQEFLTRNGYGTEKEKFTHTQALVASQALGNMVVAAVAIFLTSSGGKRNSKWTGGVPCKDWLVVAGSYFLAHSFGLAALKYIIYPLQVVIKSCKAVPVMVGEICFANAKPSLAKTVGVLLLSIGVGLFTFSSESSSHKLREESSEGMTVVLYGAMLAIAALLCDAIYGPYQNKIVAKYKAASSWVLMFNMNLYEFAIAVGVDLATSDELQQTWAFLQRHPLEFGSRLVLMCASMAIGNVFIYKIQREFGALSVTKTTTVRKLVSLVVSILWFGHSLSLLHYIAMTLVFATPLFEQCVNRWEKVAIQ